MRNLFAALSAELADNRPAVLCRIVARRGSAPRGTGAGMLALEDGRTLGTIGGGAVELQAARLARKLLADKTSRLETYRLCAGDGADGGMICGGEIEVCFQYFDPADGAGREALSAALALPESGEDAWLVTVLSGSGWRMGVCGRESGPEGLDVPEEALRPLLGVQGALARQGDRILYVEPLAQGGTVYLFGGGHVARALAGILAMADFRTVVYDQRPDAVSQEAFPAAAARICGPFADALGRLEPITAADYVVVMTPGHQRDYEVLVQALGTPAKYIGCIGSRRKVAATRERLLAGGFRPEEIDRVYAPIGLPIGGETPAEVAVSVAAQLIACRSGRLADFPGGGRIS